MINNRRTQPLRAVGSLLFFLSNVLLRSSTVLGAASCPSEPAGRPSRSREREAAIVPVQLGHTVRMIKEYFFVQANMK